MLGDVVFAMVINLKTWIYDVKKGFDNNKRALNKYQYLFPFGEGK